MAERPIRDIPEVLIPPPVLGALVLAVGLALDWLFPVYVLTVLMTSSVRLVLGLVLVAAGGALMTAAEHAFRRVGTPVPPWKPSTALATTGVYAYARNPIYVGAVMAMAGLAVALAADWLLVLLIPMSFVLHRGVVTREERYLAAKFGDAYRDYAARVPRYGWPD